MTRAYLRLDPAYDEHKESYPDGPYAALIACFCHGEMQPERGRFRNERFLRAILGRRGRHVPYLLVEGDLVRLPDGRLYIDGWDEWQEGDWKVTERVTRIRNRQRRHATVPVTPDVTVDVTPPVTAPRKGVSVSGALAVSGGADGRDTDPFDDDLWGRVILLAEELTGVPFGLGSPYGGFGQQAISQASSVPWATFEAGWRQVAAVYGRPTVRQLVFDAEDVLRPTGRAKPVPSSKEDRERAEARRALGLA